MTKDNVKHPCSCGSGIESEQCCGTKNVVKMNYDIYNDDLNALHKNLVSYAFTNYQEFILEEADFADHSSPEKMNEVEQTYLNGIALWSILNVPVFDRVKTIYDMFFQQQKEQIKRTRTKDTFATWGDASPSVYEVISIDQGNEPFATLLDVSTGKEFITPMKEENLTIGSAIIGTLIPYIGYHQFFLSMIEVYEHGVDRVVQLYQDFLSDEKNFEHDFPEFLTTLLEVDEKENLEWNNNSEEEVAALFSVHLDKKAIPEDIKTLGVLVWYEYCIKNFPTIKSSAAQAAALEYFLHTSILEDETITQKQLAKEYGTSPGALSANYRKIITSLEDDMLRESLEDVSFDDDEEINLVESTDRLPHSASRLQAQDILYEAQMTHGTKREKLIQKALSVHPNSPDAYLLLAEDAYDDSQFGRFLLQAIQAGEKDLGKSFLLKNKGSFWGILETRPYMRAKEVYANYLFEMGETEEALEHAEEMISLNPNDNQGIRYLLLPIYLELEMLEEAQNIISTYDEQSTNFLFNKVLLEYMSHGMTLATKRYIKEANQHNPYVKKFLKNIGNMPDINDLEFEYGEEFEAVEYVDFHVDLWHFYPELLRIL